MTPIENKELKGVTLRIAATVILSAIMTSGTVTGLYFKTDKRISNLENAYQNKLKGDEEFKQEIKKDVKDINHEINDIKNRLVMVENSRK